MSLGNRQNGLTVKYSLAVLLMGKSSVILKLKWVWYNKLWNEYPEYAESMMREFEEVATQSGYHVTEEESRASFERFKARMREEYGEDFI